MMPIIIVAGISIILSLLNLIGFFVGIQRVLPGKIFLSPIHYWEDYYLYLNHFFQGAHGAWLTVNRFTGEQTSPSIIYWCHILFGKIGSLLFLSPSLSYVFSIFVLSVLSLVLSYAVMRRVFHLKPYLAMIGFLMGSFSTSFINQVQSPDGSTILWPFQIWKTPHFAFDRLGGAPHHLLLTVLAYIFFLTWFYVPTSKIYKIPANVFLVLSIVCMTTLNPIQGAVFIGSLWITEIIALTLKRQTSFHRVFFVSVFFLAVFLYINSIMSGQPHIQSKIWEASQQSHTTIDFLFLSIGPIVGFAALGIFSALKAGIRIPQIFSLVLIISGYAVFMTDIPQIFGVSNTRLLFPPNYVFWGVFGALGVEFLAKQANRFLRISKAACVALFVCIYLLLVSPTLYWELQQKILPETDVNDPLHYLPAQIMDSFVFLSTIRPYDLVVAGNPATRVDTLIPAFSGHTTYSGHMLATTDNSIKQARLKKLFSLEYSETEAQTFCKTANIFYVLFTPLDGDITAFGSNYPFLIRVFDKQGAGVFRVP